MGATFEIDDSELHRRLEVMKVSAPKAFAAALYQIGLKIIADAIHRTPVDTGRLRDTAYVAPPVKSGGDIYVVLGFGTDYAIFVHERTDLRHRVGQAKFLSAAIDAMTRDFKAELTARITQNLRDGVSTTPISAEVPTSPRSA